MESSDRRRGLGTLMVRHAERQASAAGYPRLVIRANINAVGLYAALGYVPLRRDLMRAAYGVPLPVVMMEKQARTDACPPHPCGFDRGSANPQGWIDAAGTAARDRVAAQRGERHRD